MRKDVVDAIRSIPQLSESLPYVFSSGYQVQVLTIPCSACGKELGPESTHGEFESYNKHSTTLKAFGFCEPCKIITPVTVRFADDGTFLSKSDEGWVQGKYIAEAPAGLTGLVGRLKAFLSR